MTAQTVHPPELRMPFPVTANPHLPALMEESEVWARRMGMLDGDQTSGASPATWTLPQFHAMDVARLTAWALPHASLAALRVNHRLNLWALAWDDHFASAFKHSGDLVGAQVFTRRLHHFLQPKPSALLPQPSNAVERGAADLQQCLFPPHLAHWQQELNRALAQYIDAGVQELANSLTGRVPDLIEYAQFRRESFAAYTAPYSVELSTGGTIPGRIRHTWTIRALLDAFMDYMGLANDVFSYQREIHEEHDINNLIMILERLMGVPPQEAMHAAADLLNARLHHFEHLVHTELPLLAQKSDLTDDEQAGLDAWLRGACSFLSGLHAWYTRAPRYA